MRIHKFLHKKLAKPTFRLTASKPIYSTSVEYFPENELPAAAAKKTNATNETHNFEPEYAIKTSHTRPGGTAILVCILHSCILDICAGAANCSSSQVRQIKPENQQLFSELCTEQILMQIKPQEVKIRKKPRKISTVVADLKQKLAQTNESIVLSNREIRMLRYMDLTEDEKERLKGIYKVAKKLDKMESGGNQNRDQSDSEDKHETNENDNFPSFDSVPSDNSLTGGTFSPRFNSEPTMKMSNNHVSRVNSCSCNIDAAGSQSKSALKLQKYGEILISEGGEEFILCCTRCSEIFFDYNQFIKHVHMEHDVLEAKYKPKTNWHSDWGDNLDSNIKVAKKNSKENTEEPYVSKELSQESPKNNIVLEPQDFNRVEQDYSIEYLQDEYFEIDGTNNGNGEEIAEINHNKQSKTFHSLIRNKRFLWYFIDLYREHPCLWRADHAHVTDRAKRFAAVEQIAATMHQRFGFQISTAKVSKTIRNIRSCYLREFHRKAAAPNDTYVPKLWYYSKLSFIEDAEIYEEQYGAKKDNQLADIIAKRMPKCSNCQRDFNTRHGLAMHQRTHAPCKPFHCHQCGKSFSSRANLQAHMVSHVPVTERRYTCEFCGLKIALHHNYLVHLRRHTKLFAHHCLICGKGSANSTELKHHMLEHTGERPHCCEVCGLTFKLNGSLTRHRQQHEQ